MFDFGYLHLLSTYEKLGSQYLGGVEIEQVEQEGLGKQ